MDVLGSPNSNLEEDRETVRDVHLPPRQSSREDEFVVPSSIAGATGVGCTLPPDLSDRVSNSLAHISESVQSVSGGSASGSARPGGSRSVRGDTSNPDADIEQKLLECRREYKRLKSDLDRTQSHLSFVTECINNSIVPVGLTIGKKCHAFAMDVSDIADKFDTIVRRAERDLLLTLKEHYRQVKSCLLDVISELEDKMSQCLQILPENCAISTLHRELLEKTKANLHKRNLKRNDDKDKKSKNLRDRLNNPNSARRQPRRNGNNSSNNNNGVPFQNRYATGRDRHNNLRDNVGNDQPQPQRRRNNNNRRRRPLNSQAPPTNSQLPPAGVVDGFSVVPEQSQRRNNNHGRRPNNFQPPPTHFQPLPPAVVPERFNAVPRPWAPFPPEAEGSRQLMTRQNRQGTGVAPVPYPIWPNNFFLPYPPHTPPHFLPPQVFQQSIRHPLQPM